MIWVEYTEIQFNIAKIKCSYISLCNLWTDIAECNIALSKFFKLMLGCASMAK